MSSYGYTKANAKKNRKKSSGIEWTLWTLFGLLSLILVWAPFQFALFNGQLSNFELKIYVTVLFVSMMMVICAWHIIRTKALTSNQSFLMLAIFLLPVSYSISLINAASNYLAVNMLLIQFVYVAVFIASIYLSQSDQFNKLLKSVIVGSAYGVVWFGLFHWFHNSKWLSTLLGWFIPFNKGEYTHAVMVTEDGHRLTSVFQYANTYAAYLMAFLFIALFLLTTTRKQLGKFVHAFMLVPMILSIFLTLSRGGLILLPVVFIVVLLFLKPAKQLLWIIHLAISGIAALLILNPVTDIGIQVQENSNFALSVTGWLYVLGVSAFVALVCYILERYAAPWLEQKLERFSSKTWSSTLLPLGGTVLAALLLVILIGTNIKNLFPESISTRLENINFQQHSVLERLTFYKDSIKLVADYPLFGAGGGAWGALYEKYQSNPYTVAQAHSFYMQSLTDVGVIGFALFAIFLIYIYWKYIRTYFGANEDKRESHFIYLILATSILIHSVLDFNMSFVYIGILVFISLGAMTTTIEAKPIFTIKPEITRSIVASIFGVAAICLMITSSIFIQASSSFAKAKDTLYATRDFNQIIVHLKKAMELRPTHPEYAQLTADLYQQIAQQQQDEQFSIEADNILHRALEKNPYNKAFLWNQLTAGLEPRGLDEELYQIYSKNAYNFPWDMVWFEKYMESAFREGYKAINSTPEKKDDYMDEVIAAFQHIEKGVEYLKTLPEGQRQGQAFLVTPRMALNAGRAYYAKGDPGQAIETMRPYLSEDLENVDNRDLARWYVVATMQQGAVDQAWYDKLLAVDPSEKEQIEQIAIMRFK